MKGKTTVTRPNRKMTEFFSRKPKTGPRPDEPVYDVSSSSEPSVISISSDEVPPTSRLSQAAPVPGPSARVVPQVATGSRPSGHTRSTAVYISSSSQPSGTASPPEFIISSPSTASMTRVSSRSEGVTAATKSQSKRIAPPTSKGNNAKKRKQPPSNIISSDSSDGPVDPVIRVKPSSRDNASSSSRSQSYPSIDAVVAASSAPVPLTPRQNLLSSSTRPPGKVDTKTFPQTSPAKKAEQQHQPSPPKRARHGSLSTSDKRCYSTPGDADDEDEDEPVMHSLRQNWKTTPSVHRSSDDRTNADISVASTSHPVTDNETHGESDEGFKPQSVEPTLKSTPREEMQVVLPSSQQDEVELNMDQDPDAMDLDITKDPEHPPSASPSKSRADAVIARIKAEAAAEALLEQAQIERKRSLGLLDGEGETSELSSVPSESEEDDAALEFDLNTFCKTSGNVIHDSAASTSLRNRSSRTPETTGTRHSTRHEGASAPNYARKLELFRDDSPPLSKQKENAVVNGKAKGHSNLGSSCPLDDLIKDHEREDARRVQAEKKRKGPASSVRGSSPVVPNKHSGVFETPKRRGRRTGADSPGSDTSSNLGDRVGEDTLMGDAEREQLLGKEDGLAVGKILAGDRVKTGKEVKKERIVFWGPVQQGSKDVVAELTLSAGSSPVLQSLYYKIKCADYKSASLFINSGILAAVPHTVEFFGWLFSIAMSTACPALSTAAYRAVLVSQCELSGQNNSAQLNFRTLLAPLVKFGVHPQICALLGSGPAEKLSVAEASRETRVLMVCRFVIMLQALGRSKAVQADAMPSTIVTLLLLALDPSTGLELQQDVVGAIECLLDSQAITRVVELDICKGILYATASLEFTLEYEARLLAFLSGCGLSSGRVRRWTAWAMLGGDLSSVQECGDVPPFEMFGTLFTDNPTGKVRLNVDRDTDYEALGAKVEILSVALTDIEAYARMELSSREPSNGSRGSLEGICKELEWLNGKIVDTRAAHLDRTRAKDAINRLHKRVLYQRSAIAEQFQGNAGKLDDYFTKKSTGIKSKPRPKLVPAEADTQEDG